MKSLISAAPVFGSCIMLWLTSATLTSCSPANEKGTQLKEAWDERNDPSLFSLEVMKLEDLPRKGFLPDEKLPWPDSYWPTYGAGIAQRWQESVSGSDYRDYLYTPLDGERLQSDPASVDIPKLSPAEKFDLYQNRYDFPLTRFEQRRTLASVDPETGRVPTWFGLCHGWAIASLMEREPGPVAVVKNEQGLEIPFYTSDIGALLTHVYAFTATRGRFMGDRCNTPQHDIEVDENGRVVLRQCRDLNPGSLHLALTEMLGVPDPENRQPFTLDIASADEVWNQPIVGFEVTSLDVEKYDEDEDDLAQFRADGTKKLAHVEMDVFYLGGAAPHRRPIGDEAKRFVQTASYSYTLELDESGRIIGGEWTSEARPDFMWMITEKPVGSTLISYDDVAKLLSLSRDEPAAP